MNKDELLNLIPPLVAVIAPWAVRYGLNASELTGFLTGCVAIGWAAYLHWGMKKVPDAAVKP